MEPIMFIVVYVYAIVGVVIGMCILWITSDYVEASPFSRPDMSAPIWVIGAVFCGIVWPLTCLILLGEYFYTLLNRRR